MKQQYTVHYNPNLDLDIEQSAEITVEEVRECPICHFATSPTFINGYLIGSKDNNIPLSAYIILYCAKYKQLYIAKYLSEGGADRLYLQDVFPHNTSLQTFSNNITNLSSGFCEAYNQAHICENNL